MKTKRIISTIVLSAALFIVSPVDVNAYKVTDKQVTPLSDTLTMYTLTYQFGFLNADMWMPLAASKTTKDGNQTSSVVLSTASIQDKKYFVPMRTNGSFTLLVLEQHEVGQSKGYIILEKLPVTIQKKGDKKMIRVFEGEELEDFVVGNISTRG